MKINLKEFERVLSRTSVDNSFDFVQLIISHDKIKSNLNAQSRALATEMTLENAFLVGMEEHEIFEMNFNNPSVEITPYLKLFSGDEVDCKFIKGQHGEIASIKVSEKGTKMSATWNLALAMSSKIWNKPTFLSTIEFFTEFAIDEDFINKIRAVKKIAYVTNKIYFSISQQKLLIETGDKKQTHINSLQIELQDIDSSLQPGFNTMAVPLDAKVFISVMEQISAEGYKIKIAYKPEKKMGIVVITNDSTETYIMPQLIETNNIGKK